MGLFSFIGDLFGGSETTVTTKTEQAINFNPTTTVQVETDIDTAGLGEGISQGISSLGESIGEGIAEQQDIINVNVNTIDVEFNEKILSLITDIKENLFTIAIIGGIIYFIIKKGGKSGRFTLQLPKY